ncbi:MAG: hypothetical protein O2884_02445 [Chloroflexi bacterium]|nr:hypothetical protein [Chloroflexota bacterium]
MPPIKYIQLDAAEDVDDEPLAFTDVVIALYLEGLPSEIDEENEQVFESAPLAEAVIGAFCLGCAIGIEYPERLLPILAQTHEDELDEIIDECRESLTERIEEAKAATEPLEAESFIVAMTDGLDERPYVDAETAQSALSMSFEYGCVLAHVERGAAIVVRNEFNRSEEAAAEELEDQEEDHAGHDHEGHDHEGHDHAGHDHGDDAADHGAYHSVQEFAVEIIAAYEADIGPLV